MLSLPSDLKTAIRQQGLKGVHALALSSLSAKTLNLSEQQVTKERIAATEQVLDQDLTVPETRKLIAQIKTKFSEATEPNSNSLLERMQQTTKQIKKVKDWKDSQKLARIELLLNELENLITS